jgi:hypothetical protein
MRVAAPSAVPHTNGCIREMPRLRACHEVLSGVPPRASAVAAGMRDRNRDAQHKVRRRDDHVAGHPHDIDGHIVDHRQGEWETSTATSSTIVRASGRHRRPHRRPLSGRVGSTAEKKKRKKNSEKLSGQKKNTASRETKKNIGPGAPGPRMPAESVRSQEQSTRS